MSTLKRILIVDDDLLVRWALERLLNAHGYQTETSTHGVEALGLLKRYRCGFDLVICDYMLDGMNGGVVSLYIRDQCPGLPVLMISGLGPERLPDFHNLVRKPWNNTALLAKIKTTIHAKT